MLTELVTTHFNGSNAVQQQFAAESADRLVEAADVVATAMAEGGKLMLCGNGGSAADCQHIAAEFVNVLTQDFPRRALPALALTTDSSFLTARANDFGFTDVFSRQVEAIGRPSDVLLGISTSGASPNVLEALRAAQRRGIRTVGFCGSGGTMAEVADVLLPVPSRCVQYIQECHLAMGHVLVALVEELLFKNSDERVMNLGATSNGQPLSQHI